jgi:hypothetical protein
MEKPPLFYRFWHKLVKGAVALATTAGGLILYGRKIARYFRQRAHFELQSATNYTKGRTIVEQANVALKVEIGK